MSRPFQATIHYDSQKGAYVLRNLQGKALVYNNENRDLNVLGEQEAHQLNNGDHFRFNPRMGRKNPDYQFNLRNILGGRP